MGDQENSATLHEALARHFSLDELRLLCHDAGINPESVPYAERGTRTYAYEIVQACQRASRLPALISLCVQQRPAIDWAGLRADAAAQAESAPGPARQAPVDTGGGAAVGRDVTAGTFVGRDQVTFNISGYSDEQLARLLDAATRRQVDGLMALHDLLRSYPAVRDTVVEAKANLSASSRQISRAAFHKSLHDGLQQIANAYSLLHPTLYELNVMRPAEAWRWPDVRRHCTAVRGHIGDLLAVAAKGPPGEAQAAWLTELAQIDLDLQACVDARSADDLDATLSALRDILSAQVTRQNAELIAAIRSIEMQNMVDTLTRVANEVARFKERLESAAAQRLDAYVGGLAALHAHGGELMRMCITHDAWQTFDDLLRMEYAQLYADVGRLRREWHKRILPKFALILISAGASWERDLRTLAGDLEGALAGGYLVETRETLWDLRSCVNRRFNQIDHDLKSACEQLVVTNRPLESVLEALN